MEIMEVKFMGSKQSHDLESGACPARETPERAPSHEVDITPLYRGRALAAWMLAQYQSTRLDAGHFEGFLKDQILGYHDQEYAALPPPIPANTVIALPANAALRTDNTTNLP